MSDVREEGCHVGEYKRYSDDDVNVSAIFTEEAGQVTYTQLIRVNSLTTLLNCGELRE